ncbi:acyl-CoA dehydrogenase [Pelagibaculum spongiae]|uniref:acyl-CoA dehydrogenase n=1 Tax=Pelagibaculum spongiae TaxID=2080658 RepID=UPI001F4E2A10|nr:acyl-CoA dehydrogenase [Pelagibaculum spongiae]
MTNGILLALALAGAWAMAYRRSSLKEWTIYGAAALAVLTLFSGFSGVGLAISWLIFAAVAVPLNMDKIRLTYISGPILKLFRKIMPTMSQTEKEALDAGTVWWDGEIFAGDPNWKKLLSIPKPTLTEEEQAFLDGPVEAACRMCDDWKVVHEDADLTPETWQFLKDEGFFSMIIKKKYGGKDFSALAHSEVLAKLSAHSATLASTVAVPNSLGPAELLQHYGTEEQKNHYLPRLAKGLDIPCFALTNPEAGSDAGSIPDTGIVCKGQYQGKEVIGMRMNWNKRYITLAPVATVIGLAFKMFDPEGLLGDKKDIGITCALIPRNFPGVEAGRRHIPLGTPFMNGTTKGKDVFIPLDFIIGGVDMAGHGWRMLVECLSVGRSISLPSSAAGGARAGAIATGAYARIRRQFKTAIGQMEGIEEALGRLGGNAYRMEAVRAFTAFAVDLGEKPSVPSAIAKLHVTEMGRQCANDAMDIQGGKAIVMGPRNAAGRAYMAVPIGITVEGANILTRNLILFGQGAMRCHPYVLKELDAAANTDDKQALKDFDKALFGHVGFVISNAFRSLWLGLSRGYFAKAPATPTKRYYQHLTRISSSFAILADVSMAVLGAELKRKESVSARLGDALAMMYIGSAVLKRWEDQGRPAADRPFVDWAMDDCIYQADKAMSDLLKNYPNKFVGAGLRALIFPLGFRTPGASDKLSHKVSALLIEPNEARDRLAKDVYTEDHKFNLIGQMETVLRDTIAAEPIVKKIDKAIRKGELAVPSHIFDLPTKINYALEAGMINEAEKELLTRYEAGRLETITVDDWDHEDMVRAQYQKKQTSKKSAA